MITVLVTINAKNIVYILLLANYYEIKKPNLKPISAEWIIAEILNKIEWKTLILYMNVFFY